MPEQPFCMKTWRNAMGWTQQKTADELGYVRSATISQMECGAIKPSQRVILACKYLENRNRI